MNKIENSAKAGMLLDGARLLEKFYGETLDPESVKGYGFCWYMNAEDKDAYCRNGGFYEKMNRIGICDSAFIHGNSSVSNMGIGNDGGFLRTEYYNVMYRIFLYLYNMKVSQLTPYTSESPETFVMLEKCMPMLANYVELVADKQAGDAFRHHIDEEDMPLWSQFYAFFKLSGIIYDEKTEPWLVQEDGSFNGAQLMHTLYKGYERLFNSLVPEEAE